MSTRTLVIIPTYNERENLPTIVSRLFDNAPDVNLLIVDDGSPDGTGDLADEMAARDPRVFAMHRASKLGLGSAYTQGFGWGLERGYDTLVEMDADGSHPAQTLPVILRSMGAESTPGSPALVIGSRWVDGGSVVNWPKSREILSRGANAYARFALGIQVKDSTAGFRAYRGDVLAAMDLTTVDSYGYCFQIDMALRVIDAGYAVLEVPIVFGEREIGESKMSRAIVLEAMWKVTAWGATRRARQLRSVLRTARKSRVPSL
jgi:dolichol-phosphate mannosyltransferase